MKIAVIGAGNVGVALGRRWSAAGHEVVYGVRDPRSAKAIDAARGAALDTVAGAAAAAPVILLAVPWGAVEDTCRAMGDVAGKVVLDATNPLAADLSSLTVGTTSSGGEIVAGLARGARVVKIFNTTGANIMERALTPRPTMLYAGDHADANAVAAGLAADAGFAPQELGGLAFARALEPMALAWIQLAIRKLGRNFTLDVVPRGE